MEKNNDFDNDGLFDRAKDYVNTSIELKKLGVIQSVVKTVGSVVNGLVLLIVSIFFLMFLSIAVGLYLGELLDSMYLGFFLVTLFYLVLAILVGLMGKNYIQNPVTNTLISKIFQKSE